MGYDEVEIDELVRAKITVDGRRDTEQQKGKPNDTTRFSSGAGALAVRMLSAPAVHAQAWPSRTIAFIIPFPPGGTNDILARPLADKLSIALGASVILDNRGGAGGSIGMTAAARSAPDGYTITIGHIGTPGVNPSSYLHLHDTLKSFDFIAPLALVPNIMAVHPSLPVKSIAELIEYAKAKPGQLNYATAGPGSAAHIAMAAFNVAARRKWCRCRIAETSPAVIDLSRRPDPVDHDGSYGRAPARAVGALRGIGVSTLKRLAVARDSGHC